MCVQDDVNQYVPCYQHTWTQNPNGSGTLEIRVLNPNISAATLSRATAISLHQPRRRSALKASAQSASAVCGGSESHGHCGLLRCRAQLTSALETTRRPVARVGRPAAAAATGLTMALVAGLVLVRASSAGDTAAITPLTTW